MRWRLRWGRFGVKDECRAERALGAAEFFPGASRQVRGVRKRRGEGNARAAQGTTRVESRYTIQTCDPSVSRTAVRWGPQFFFERPAKIPRSFLRSFSLWACSAHATFGLHRFSLTQFAARLAM